MASAPPQPGPSRAPAPPLPPTRWARAAAAAWLALWIAVEAILIYYAPPRVGALGAAWAVFGFLSPRWYLATLGLAFPLFGDNPGGPHHLYLLDMGLIGFVARDLLLRVAGRRGVRPSPLDLPLRLFLLVSALAVLPQRLHLDCEFRLYGLRAVYNAYYYFANAPFYGLRAWLNLALCVGMLAALRDDPLPARWRKRVWRGLFAGLLVASALGVLEYFGLVSLEWWRPANPLITRFGYARLQSLFRHSGWFAQYLVAIAPAALAFGLHQTARWRRWFWPAVAGALWATLLLTMQRGAWLGMAAGFGAVGLGFAMEMPRPARRRFFTRASCFLAGSFVVVALLSALLPPLRHRLAEMFAFRDRALIWGSAWNMGLTRPMAGVGLGHYAFNHPLLFGPASPYFGADDKTTGHNLWLHIFAERGLLAVAFMAIVYGGALARLGWIALHPHEEAARQRAEPGAEGDDPFFLRSEPLALLGCLAALLIEGVFQYTFYIRLTEILFWMLVAFSLRWPGAPSLSSVAPRRQWIAAVLVAGAYLWFQRPALGPWEVGAHGLSYRVGGAVAQVPLPRGARRIALPLHAWSPGLPGQPLTVAVWLGDTLLGTQVFTDNSPALLELDLPADRDPAEKLTLKSSRSFDLYSLSERKLPFTDVGVLYQNPRAI